MNEKPFGFGALTHNFSKKWKALALALLGLAIILAGAAIALPRHYANAAPASPKVYPALSGDWTTYMYNIGRSGYNGTETVINQSTAPNLKLHWTSPAQGAIFSQPVVANGLVYWGSFDGYEYATDLNGKQIWQTSLGQTTKCTSSPLGVVSTAAIASVLINGVSTTVDFVGGGDGQLYALDANHGNIIWQTPLGAAGTNTFIWDSPLVYNNSVYIGTATTGENVGCKVVPAAFYQLNAATGMIQNSFNTVASGCTGGGIWGSPTFDASDNSIYFSTGTQGKCLTKEQDVIGLIKLSAANLSYMDSWQILSQQRTIKDSDFGTTPTLFTRIFNGSQQKLVGLANKDGIYYVFDRTAISKGPVWTANIAVGGPCPQCGQGSISSSVWDGTRLYVAGGNTTINNSTCGGSLRALDPATGGFLWQDCFLKQFVMGAVTEVPGVVAVIAGPAVILVNANTGATLFKYKNAEGTYFYGSPSISNGVLYAGNLNSKLYAIGT